MPGPNTITPKKANVIIYLISLAFCLVTFGVVFFYIGIIPLVIAEFVGTLGVFIGVMTGIIQAFQGFFKNTINSANHTRRMILFGLITSIIVALIAQPILSTVQNKHASNLSPATLPPTSKTPSTHFSSPSSTPTVQQTIIASNTTTISTQLIKQKIPYCENSSGWNIPSNMRSGTANPVCSSSELQLQQNSPSASRYAELDFDSNGSYNQTAFIAKVTVTLTQDDPDTYGCLIVQTPSGHPGGFILCVNDRGEWQLQDATDILHPTTGAISSSQGQPINLSISVQNSSLVGTVNGQNTPSIPDNLSDGVVGLLVEKTGAIQSAPVIYQNFEIDIQS